MTFRQLIRHLFPALIVAGLVLSPFSASAAMNAIGGEAMMAMAGDMADCRSTPSPAPDCQKTCPLMTVCAVNWITGTPVLVTTILAFGVRADTVRPANDVFGGPLAEGPPARPPQT